MCARAGVLAVLLCVTVCRITAVELLIVHYELFGETSPRLLAALANSVRNVRAAERHVIVLNAAGANVTGVVTDAHAVGVASVAELGSVPLLTHPDGATVAANLRLPAPLRASVRPSVTLELGAAGRVGVIGVVPTELEAAAAGAAVTDAVAAVRQEASRLRQAGVGTLLALGRLGGAEALQLARQVPELDALVVPGGFRARGVYPQTVSRDAGGALPLLEAPLVAAPGYLGLVTLTLAPGGRVAGWRGRVVPLRAPGSPPPAAGPAGPAGPGTVNKASFCAAVAGKVGETLSELDGRRVSCSRRECSLGSALADALLLAAVRPTPSSWSEVSLALLSAGSLSGSLPRCAVSEADLAAATATDTTAVSLSIAGTYLRQAFEQSAAGHGSAAFLQVSGVRVVYDLSRPAGSRVRQLKVLCSECLAPRYVDVQGDVLYRLVTSSRLAGGGDGYDVVRTHGKSVADSHRSERDIYREYLRTRSPVPPPTGGRIFFMGEHGPDSELQEPVSELLEPAAADEPAAALIADGSEPGADGAAADTPAASPAPSKTETPDAATEASPGVSASDLFIRSTLWTFSGFAMLGMMIMALF